ncbi:MAG: peptidoglycan DD-metalloendopeptidase family protein, partial [Sulfurovum sp.]|nr:peptidoglycan DD-metalloendopeptidase family protein [Sulfurovum sp.]
KIKKISAEYQVQNENFKVQQKELITLIQESSEKYTSVKTKLLEVEDMIGIGPDMNASFQARLEEERTKATENLRVTLHEKELSNMQKTLLSNIIPNGKPLNYKRVSSPFGYRTHPTKKNHSFHPALDLTAKHGTPIYAPASGVVVYAKRKGAYGNFLLLAHSFGFKTAYGHLSRFAVKSGDYVSKGDIIAYVGSTGRSTGPHLHYEIRYLTKWLDPKKFMHLNLENINNISANITSVNWDSILKQIEKLISLAKT